MLDGYGIRTESPKAQEQRLKLARESYEVSCLKRGAEPDWDRLDPDDRYMWFMTADALMRYGQERHHAIAC